MYEKLLFPAKINNRTINNKIIASPPPTYLCEKDGSLTPQFFNYYNNLAKSEPGAIIIESSAISETGKSWPKQPVISDNLNFLAISELVIKIRNHNILPLIQLYHGGLNAIPNVNHTVYSPSEFYNKKITCKVHPLTNGEIEAIIEDYKKAATLAWNVGFSGIELNAAEGSLLHQFLTPIINKRNDKYSFIYNNGVYLLRKIIHEIKTIAPDMLFCLKLSMRDLIPSGACLKTAIEIANEVKNIGVDIFHVTEGLKIGNPGCIHPYLCGKNYIAPFGDDSNIFKNETKTTVILSTGIAFPDIAEKLLNKDYCDYISLGRIINREPKWVTMAMTNQPVEFYRKCKNCMICRAGYEGCILQKKESNRF